MTMSRSFLFAALVAFCAMFSGVSATFSQGALQLTRDYGIKYTSVYVDNEAFCKGFRAACVTYAGSLGEHHQLDCVFAQSSSPIRAWCGGIEKNASGGWTAGEAQVDNTRAVIAAMGSKKAKITNKPMTYKKCLAAKKYNSAVTCVA